MGLFVMTKIKIFCVSSSGFSRKLFCCAALCFVTLGLSGCGAHSSYDEASVPVIDKVAAMDREPITRLAFVPTSEEAYKIEITKKAPVLNDIETAAGAEKHDSSATEYPVDM